MTQSAGLSLASLNTRTASETPFEFEYITSDGSSSGLFLSVLGAQSELIQGELLRYANEARRKEAIATAKAAVSRPGAVDVRPIEEDRAWGEKMAAMRIVGWRGLDEPYTPENALKLCEVNPEIAAQVVEASNRLGNFLKLSPAK